MSEPRQASLRRLRRFQVRPNRELGQNFLIDDNLLGVIERAAELDESDVVLEVGGGLGVLSEHLAPRVSHLHVVEVDRSLEPALADALAPFANASLHLADAVRLDLGALRPPPTKVVANLPYGVAATVLLKSIAELPSATLWVAMVQREVGERLAAPPGGRSYGASSVLAQLACDVRVLRKVPRTVSTRPRTWTPCSSRCAAAARRRTTPCATSCTPDSRIAARPWAAHSRSRRARLRGSVTTFAPRSSGWTFRRTPAPSGCTRSTGRGWPTRSGAERRHVACRPWSASSRRRS